MNIIVFDNEFSKLDTAMLVIPVFEDQETLPEELQFLDENLQPQSSKIIESSNFKGKLEDYRTAFTRRENLPLLILLGAGKVTKWTMESARKFFGRAIKIAAKLNVEEFSIYWNAEYPLPKGNEVFFSEIANAMCMAMHKTSDYQTHSETGNDTIDIKEVKIAYMDAPANLSAFLEEGVKIGEAVNLARRLADLPGNILTPTAFVEKIQELQKVYGWDVEVLHKAQLEKQGLNAHLAVAKGSRSNPYLALIKYENVQANGRIALVGKGVTFDSGGLSLKPPKSMETMKYDMCGAAAVLGALQAISEAKLPVNIVAAIPLVENLPSGEATRPGDIITSYDGTTIEVLNTDAEGRLILADAIAYVVKNYQPSILIDLATLTGAIVVALGHLGAGILGNDKGLIEELRDAGNITGEYLWPLPAWQEYSEFLKSDIADIRNISKEKGAGAITAGMFLKKFVGDTNWVHIDIAGTAWDMPERSYRAKGATGFGVRLIFHWLKNIHMPGQQG